MSLSELKNSLDEKVWDIYSKGLTCTVNQVDSDFGTNICKRYKPHSVEDIAKICAAIRPSFNAWREQFLSRKPYTNGNKYMDDLLKDTDHYILFQENVMQYFEWLGVSPAESIGLIKKISKKKIHPEDFKNLEDRIKSSWIDKVGTIDGFQDNWEMIQGCMAYGFNCISGKTIIDRGFKNQHSSLTVEEMYFSKNNKDWAKKNGHINLYKKYNRHGYGYSISMQNDNRLRKNNILDIYYAGYKNVYRITTESGKYIDCTLNHKFPTIRGELQLSELNVGDYLYCKDKYDSTRIKNDNLTNGKFELNYPQKGECGFQKKNFSPTRLYREEKNKHIKNGDCCEICGAPMNKRFELHHKDLDPTNNCIENHMWLCNNCHKRIHYKQGRTKSYEKGIPVKLEKIISIDFVGKENVYNVSMSNPYHNYVVNDGVVTSNSPHALGYAYDSLYCAYLKSHYPIEYYSVVLNIYENDEERTSKLTKELDYFGIKLNNPKFRYSKSDYFFDNEQKTIYKGTKSIKFLNGEVSNALYDLRNNQYEDFSDALKDILGTGINSRQLNILIKLDYFSEFGNSKELLRIVDICTMFKNGEAKSMSKTKLENDNILYRIVARNSNETPKKFTINNCWNIIKECEFYIKSVGIKDFTYKEKADFQNEYMGYIDLKTNDEKDRPNIFVLSKRELKSKTSKEPWAVQIEGQSIGSGIRNSYTIFYKEYKKEPFDKMDIIRIKRFHKNNRGYWNVDSYERMLGI